MTLEEAIKHCEEKSIELKNNGCESCANDHEVLARWLKELLYLREVKGFIFLERRNK